MKKSDMVVSTIFITIGVIALIATIAILTYKRAEFPSELDVYSNNNGVGKSYLAYSDWEYPPMFKEKIIDNIEDDASGNMRFSISRRTTQDKENIKITKQDGLKVSLEKLPQVVKNNKKTIEILILNEKGNIVKQDKLEIKENEINIDLSSLEENTIYYVCLEMSIAYGRATYTLKFIM